MNGTRYAFSSWSDGGSRTHTITAPSSNATYTAGFTTQYSLTTSGTPANAGTVSPAGTRWYDSGQSVTVTASPASGYSFGNWSGALTGTTNPATLTMNGAKSVAAGFVAGGTFIVTPGSGISVTGAPGGSFSPASIVFTLQNTGASTITWTGSKTQSWVSLSASSGTLAAGASTTVTASINSNAGNLAAGTYADTVTFTSSPYGTNPTSLPAGTATASRSIGLTVATATSVYTISTNPSGLQIIVDGVSFTSPKTFNWSPGSSHTLAVSSPLGGSTGIRHLFSSWSDGGAQSHGIVAAAATTNYVATFSTQYQLTASSNPANAGATSPAGTTWQTKGQTLSLAASPNSGYAFSGWSGHLQGMTNPQAITMDAPKSVTANFSQATGKIHPSLGIFRKGSWYFDGNGNGGWDGCEIDICIDSFGGYQGDIPVAGDWRGNGWVNIGIYRNGQWYLDADGSGTFDDCSLDRCVKESAHLQGGIPLAGDWTGDGRSKLGIYRNGQWLLDKNRNRVWDGCEIDTCIEAFGGLEEDIPVIGDWNGDGKDKIGVYRKGQWVLDLNGNGVWDGCEVDACIEAFGGSKEDIPVIGDWNGDGKDKIGVYRKGLWFLDLNGNGGWDGCEVDFCSVPFGGLPGDLPTVARHPKTF